MRLVKSIIYSLLLLISVGHCNNSLEKGEEKKLATHPTPDTSSNPKVAVKVNKKYDAHGNLIKFDSTYTYIYTSKGMDSIKVAMDTLINRFKSTYKNGFSGVLNKRLDELFLNDSLFKYDFLNDDFFTKRFNLNTQRLNEAFQEVDSLKNAFLNQSLKKQPKKKINR